MSQAATDVERAEVQAATAALGESEAKLPGQKRELDRLRKLVDRHEVDQETVDLAADQYASSLARSNTARSQLVVARAAEAETTSEHRGGQGRRGGSQDAGPRSPRLGSECGNR